MVGEAHSGLGLLTVEMVGASDVVTWDDRDELSSSVRAGGLDAAQGIGGDCRFRAVAVAPCCNTGVHTLISLESVIKRENA